MGLPENTLAKPKRLGATDTVWLIFGTATILIAN
jgi:hypothetical protein